MKVEPDIVDNPSPDSAGATSCFVLMRVSQPLPLVTSTTVQAPVTNTMRATTITVLLQRILTDNGCPHEGINEYRR